MSNLARAWAERQDAGPGCRLHLLEAIAAYHNDDHGFCSASNRYLAARLKKAEATIERGLAALEAAGLIKRETTRWGPDGGARRRIYLQGYDPVAVERELQARRDTARERRAARYRSAAPGAAAGADVSELSTVPIRSPQNEGQVPSPCGSGPLIVWGSESLAESRAEDSSEPDGSGPGTPAPSAKARLFSEGRSILTALGLKPREAGDLIGRWLKASGEDAERVLATIRRAEAAAPHGPIPWITAALKPLQPNGAAHGLRPDGASGTAAARRSGRSSLSVALAGVARVAASRGIQFGKPANPAGCPGPADWPSGYPTGLAEAHRHDAHRYRPADRST